MTGCRLLLLPPYGFLPYGAQIPQPGSEFWAESQPLLGILVISTRVCSQGGFVFNLLVDAPCWCLSWGVPGHLQFRYLRCARKWTPRRHSSHPREGTGRPMLELDMIVANPLIDEMTYQLRMNLGSCWGWGWGCMGLGAGGGFYHFRSTSIIRTSPLVLLLGDYIGWYHPRIFGWLYIYTIYIYYLYIYNMYTYIYYIHITMDNNHLYHHYYQVLMDELTYIL